MKHLLLSILILLFLPLFATHAQIGNSVVEQGIVIKTTPAYPEPHQSYTASLDDYSSISKVTSITWRVDGTVLSAADNLRSINLQAPEAGKSAVIEASVTFAVGGGKIIKKIIKPAYLDIIVEPQTKTPSFYLGRSLPSAGSVVNLTAVLSLDKVLSTGLIYNWRVNNITIGGGSQRDINKVSITTPQGTSFLVSLEVSTLSGEILARRTVAVPSVSPTLHFYEKSSLYGLGTRSLKSVNVTGDSVSIQAEPYNLAIETYNQPDLVEWKINGLVVQNKNINPYEIILSSDNQTFSSSLIDFHVRDLDKLLQGVRGQFKLNF